MEENHFGVRPNHLSHPTDGGSYVPKRRDVTGIRYKNPTEDDRVSFTSIP